VKNDIWSNFRNDSRGFLGPTQVTLAAIDRHEVDAARAGKGTLMPELAMATGQKDATSHLV